MHLEHVNLTVADLERSIDFYSRLFGFSVRWRGESNNGKPAAHVGSDAFYLALFQARDTTIEAPKSYDSVGLNHVGFVVDDMDAMKERLVELDTAWKGEQIYDPGHHIYFFDPSGIEIELVQYAADELPIPAPADRDGNASPTGDAPAARPTALARATTALRLGFDSSSPQLPVGKLALPL